MLREYAFLPDKRRGELRPEHKAALAWLEAASLPLVDLMEPAGRRRTWSPTICGCCTTTSPTA
ncbi:hypothetical protein ACIBI0_37895 [Microbispora rosea]|uniref:hypothetical protein n=1 Tax=Microbispora rosea TaxID=58117 RepID=UPI0037976D64